MNFRTTIILVLIAVLIGGYFFLVERGKPTAPEVVQPGGADEPSSAGTPLFTDKDLSTEAVVTVTVERDGVKSVLHRDSGDWRQVAPVRFPLDTWSVKGLISAAASSRWAQKLQPGKNNAPPLEKLGLAPPRAVVTLATEGDRPATVTLKVGAASLGGRGFMMVGEDPAVYVVNDAVHRAALDQKPQMWRSKTLRTPAEGQADRVTLTQPGHALDLVKSGGAWSLGPPDSGRADAKSVSALLAAANGIYIEKFIADAPANPGLYGLDKPAITLAVTVPPPPPATSRPADAPEPRPTIKTLRIGAPVDLGKESFFAAWDDGSGSDKVVFSIAKRDSEKLVKTVDDMRDAKITPLAAGDITEATFHARGGKAVKLQRGPGGWMFALPGPVFKADHNEVSNLVSSLTDARATGYVADAKPVGEPLATITLAAIGKSEPDVLRLYAAEKNKDGTERMMTLRNGETTGYLVPASALANAIANEAAITLALRDRVVFDIPRDRINRVVVQGMTFNRTVPPATQPAGTQPAAPGPWTLDGKDLFETAALETLLNALTPLRADAWMPHSTSDHPAPEVLYVQTADGVTRQVTIQAIHHDMSADGVDAPFVSSTLLKAIHQEFRHRTVLPLAASEFKQVTVTRGGKSVTIHKDADGKYTGGEGVTVNQAAAGGLFDTLANLRVERYLYPVKPVIPKLEILVETQSGGKIGLAIPGVVGVPATCFMRGTLGESTFSVSTETLKKLQADLMAKEEKPAPMGGDEDDGDR